MALTKVKLQVYTDKAFRDKLGEFELPINPEQFSQSFKVEYNRQQAQGSQRNDPEFKFTHPEELKLDFTFDGTGVVAVNNKPGEFHKDVTGQVQTFLDLVYNMNSETHKPNFLRLLWGEFSFGERNGFDCVLTDLQINYTLFDPTGKPLRAKLSATFSAYVEQGRRVREEGKESPDVTHRRKVTAGDTLPLMTHRIYGDPTYYLQIAKVNGLINFRRLAANTDLRFPPLEKTQL
ncbi:LysM peptidoglycan-binding domain-containing protein [Scytonema sp. UIC 10036]|uniref:CIS tube protein n=1 Tax=Scytonema sp. UIC 10036 TaxID=2304196 RepID=UPI0012DAE04A|nr:LysM peptidoglycan-binding domain-containing protein [Scytonema sp. UIC 10036]MUG97761.1 LysM peptidoglycan-binding domain-containing protein [Scytonema sp. UIC 10036]